jgi:hypothetical protein
MTVFSALPCSDNWETCDFCGAPPGDECRNPDYKKEKNVAKSTHKDPHAQWVLTGRGPKPPKPSNSTPKDTNPKSAAARAKASLSLVPSVAIFEMAQAFRDGAAKYGPYNWRKDPVSISVYLDAAFRHMELYRVGQDVASDSNLKHVVHAMSCFAILLDAEMCGSLIDDRDKMEDPSLLEDFLEQCRIINEG